MRFRLPEDSETLGWWIATASAMGLAITSLLFAIVTRNPREFAGIPPAIALAIVCCPLTRVKRQSRILGTFAMIALNFFIWFTVIWVPN
ncbi:hypothetical protein ACQ4M3_29080 [Leptolyngbya sp. AN03gr2]|uniref:hypothetical protein n=1 Tax=unclassified Leptolyngbya TaxID=2650499 RepID=UPI003D3241F0